MLKYNSYKIFQDKIGNQYLYLIDDNAIFLLDEKSKKMLSLEGLKFNEVNSNPRIPFVTQDSLFVNEKPVLKARFPVCK